MRRMEGRKEAGMQGALRGTGKKRKRGGKKGWRRRRVREGGSAAYASVSLKTGTRCALTLTLSSLSPGIPASHSPLLFLSLS